MASLFKNNPSFEVRVSSVLNRDVKKFGKKYIFDGKEDTCWNSDEGTPQWVTVEFTEAHTISGFKIQFQGGFAGQNCNVELHSIGGIITEPFYPEDVNIVQHFLLSKSVTTKQVKFIFDSSTDFFGRIIIYSMDVLSDS